MSIVVVNCGGDTAYQVARYLRGNKVFCLLAGPGKLPELLEKHDIRGIVAVGSKNETIEPIHPAVLECGLPLLAIGDAARQLLVSFGGSISEECVENRVRDVAFADVPLFHEVTTGKRNVDCAYGLELPACMEPLGGMAGMLLAFGHKEKPIYGFQCNAEVHDYEMMRILRNFSVDICGCEAMWTLRNFETIVCERIEKLAGDKSVFMTVTGGVDSAVLASLAHKALGDRLQCVFIDTGFLRKDENDTVEYLFRERMGIKILRVFAQDRFLRCLEGVEDPREKRERFRREYSGILYELVHDEQKYAGQLIAAIYPDLLGGEYSDMLAGEVLVENMPALAPMQYLFKDEVRSLGEYMKVPHSLVQQQPFPDAGLAMRCRGAITKEKIEVLRQADALFAECVQEAGLVRHLNQYFAALLDPPALSGDLTYDGYTVLLRAVQRQGDNNVAAQLPGEFLSHSARRLTEAGIGVTRVFYDISDQPSAAVEVD